MTLSVKLRQFRILYYIKILKVHQVVVVGIYSNWVEKDKREKPK